MPRTFAVSPVSAVRSPVASLALRDSLAERGLSELESLSTCTPLIRVPAMHGVLGAIHLAFAEHRPLVLSPDHIWICITQAVARHVAANAETLRHRFVKHDGQKELEIRRDLFRAGDPTNDWAGAVTEFSGVLERELGSETHGLFACSASTTDALARTASEIVLMGAMQRYFTYTVATLCGIPELTLEGTPEDWKALRAKVERFAGLGLDAWLPALRAFLEQFIAASLGRPSEAFFRQLYKVEDSSGGKYVSGFVNTLFPYLGDAGAGDRELNPLALELAPRERNALECPKLDAYPSGFASVPFEWKFMTASKPMSLVAGFVGVSQNASTGALRPELGWAVTPRVMNREFVLMESPSGIPSATLKDRTKPLSFAALARETAHLPEVSLSIWFDDTIESLEGVRDVPNLVELTILGAPRLRTLAPLAGHPRLRKLMVQQCDSFDDASAIATLPALEDLMLAHLPRLERFAPVASPPNLSVLGLFGGNVPMRWVGQHKDRARIVEIQAQARA